MKKLYLAYGSNLNKAQMKIRCPHAREFGTAVLRNYELLFKGSKTGSYLTIEPKHGGKVPAAVWEVDENDIKALDRYEGYPAFYYKKELVINVRLSDGTIERRCVFVYIMHENREIAMPSQGYVDTCREGYGDFGFDEKFLDAAIERSRV